MTAKSPAKPPRPYGGLSPEERTEERRRRLWDAGLELFGTAGYRSTSIQALCAEAHVTARHFYELFDTSEALFREVYDGISETCLEHVFRGLGSAGSSAERIRAAVRAAVTYLLEDPRRARVQCVESHAVSARFAKHRSEVLNRYAQLFAEQGRTMGNAQLSETQLGLTAVALVNAADSIIAERLRQPETVRIEDCCASLSHLLCAAAGVI